MVTNEMIEAVKKYAQENYSEGGWDVIVECYEDAEIRRALEVHEQFNGKTISTSVEAIEVIGELVDIMHDQMIDSWADGGLCTKCASPEHEASKCPNGA
jgi:hypothetical protein